jgi:hypothetical protein
MNHQRVATWMVTSLVEVFGVGCAERQTPRPQSAGMQNAAVGSASQPAKTEPPAPGPSSAAQVTPTSTATRLSPPIDDRAVVSATGVEKVDTSPDGTVKASFPRKDVDVIVDGWKMPPFMGLTSWAAFSPGKAEVAEAMVMGDLVLFEDEVNPVMSVLFENGLDVTALHNHGRRSQARMTTPSWMAIRGERARARPCVADASRRRYRHRCHSPSHGGRNAAHLVSSLLGTRQSRRPRNDCSQGARFDRVGRKDEEHLMFAPDAAPHGFGARWRVDARLRHLTNPGGRNSQGRLSEGGRGKSVG